MKLKDGKPGTTYEVSEICTDDSEMEKFLFSLGCYSGEPVTVISNKKNGCIVCIRDGRYSLDKQLSEAVIICNQ